MYTEYQHLAFDMLNTLRTLAMVFSHWYMQTAPEIEMNPFDIGFFHAAQWLLSLVGVGMIAYPNMPEITTLKGKTVGLLRSLLHGQELARKEFDTALDKLGQANAIMWQILGEPTTCDINEEYDLVGNCTLYDSTVMWQDGSCTRIISGPYTTWLSVHVSPEFSAEVEKYYYATGETFWHLPHTDWSKEMNSLDATCESAHALTSWSKELSAGMLFICTELQNALAQAESASGERELAYNQDTAPYVSLVDNSPALTWTEVDTSVDSSRWTYP